MHALTVLGLALACLATALPAASAAAPPELCDLGVPCELPLPPPDGWVCALALLPCPLPPWLCQVVEVLVCHQS